MTRSEQRGRRVKGPLPSAADLRRDFGGIKHARYHDRSVSYHHLLRTVQGRFLLRPDDKGTLEKIIAGAIARAHELYASVELYADAWLSNHAHLELRGDPEQMAPFTGFIEREVSRRWGAIIGWEGNMFQTYQSTALPTEESERRAFRYVLSQSAKEHLVESPLKWPGAHCAKQLVRGFVRRGIWFDGTGYGRAVHQGLARKYNRNPPPRHEFERKTEARFSKLPALGHLSDDEYHAHVRQLVHEIESAAAEERRITKRRVLGRRKVLRMSRETRSTLPRPPWFERRRRMICWADRRAPATRAYLQRYWEFQRAFRIASKAFLLGELDAPFPPGCFRPSVFVGTSPAHP